MRSRKQYVLVGLSVFAIALCLRTVTLYWSPFPAALDGFDYAALARDTIAVGHLPLERFRADNFVFAGILTLVSLISDTSPVKMAQPMVAVIGAASCLTAVAVTRRIGRALDFSSRQVRYAAVLAGVTLAVEGLYLRRTGVADEEAVGLLLVPLLAIALHRAIRTYRTAWVGITAIFMFAFPLVHTFSTLIAALTTIGVLTMQALRTSTRRLVTVGGVLVVGFWAYFAIYYEAAARVGITVPYVGRIFAFPGLFVAWLVVLVVGVLWLRSTSRRLQTGSLLAAVGCGYIVLIANVFLTVFPGTVLTPLPILALVLPFIVPVVLASRGLPLATIERSEGAVVIALLAAPVVQVYFSLTASLTPEFFGTVMRTQTFAHFPIFVLAALAAVQYAFPASSFLQDIAPSYRPSIGNAILGLLVVSAVVTAPLAFIDLDTAAYPSTTTHSEFSAVTFTATHVPGHWAAADPLTRVGMHYYPDRTKASQIPVGNWLTGGSPPVCPTLSRESWTTTGAHLFPQAPATIDDRRYKRWLLQRNLVYSNSGSDSIALTRPVGETTRGC